MKTVSRAAIHRQARRGERGAALITTLLMSTLLLAAGGALILTSTMTATNTVDAAAETQAYYAAEAGMQTTLNALRGNVAPNVNFRLAVTPSTSNKSGDSSTTATPAVARMSNWLSYSTTYTDRVILTTPVNSYLPFTGSAFKAEVSDPDSSSQVTFTTTGAFADGSTSKTFGSGRNSATLSFTGLTTTVSACPSVTANACTSANTNLGSFSVSIASNSNGAQIPQNTPFTITVTQTAPWAGSVTITCALEGDLILGSATPPKIIFPSTIAYVEGTKHTVSPASVTIAMPAAGSSATTTLSSMVAAPEPRRMKINVTGYGPHGAVKQMQMMIGRFALDYWPRGTVAFRGSDAGTQMTFNPGDSSQYKYSGNDADSSTSISGFAVTNTNDYNYVSSLISTNQVTGSPSVQKVATSSLPSWLQTADAARAMLTKLQAVAKAQNRYYTTAPASYPSYGTAAAPALTFVDGDVVLPNKSNVDNLSGAGLLVVTGTLTMDGNSPFDGLILVLGTGKVVRNGSGNGSTLGALAVASFNRTTAGSGFLAPTFQGNGGGTSDLLFNLSWVQKALNATGRYVLGVSEH
ncbi:MAG TPA: hypothetical protein VF723_09030 [Pyrinomonadaceae bacterium]|jgi:hypothetical protein